MSNVLDQNKIQDLLDKVGGRFKSLTELKDAVVANDKGHMIVAGHRVLPHEVRNVDTGDGVRRHRPGGGTGADLPVPVRVELHRHRPGVRPAACGGDQRPGSEEGGLLR